ncbi:hypothetical protein F3K20_03510 [Streptomyces scabiei]|nr:hypothetical protein [Streptomyces sp. LBUM 1484]MBP5873763.1 hypothetical protein [Streptomyces sp. LBUM 1477]MBP5881475.1 hypothetical protein [Streptomyces sp. LBUM 1487]MBP5897246.1 hypothetical protein [Streptomyces sp. LBUM 1488]QTU44062.1 hypothetical protein F3K20_03510 [Streptomyces sp. LBUM 1482]QTU60199.1 hypothetical protein F3K22_03480 [Streptomyces sp. LBUM 1475]
MDALVLCSQANPWTHSSSAAAGNVRPVATPGTLPHSRLRSSGRGPHRRTGHKPEHIQHEGMRPARREHAPDAAPSRADVACRGTSRGRQRPAGVARPW